MPTPFQASELADNSQSPNVSAIFVAIVQEPVATLGLVHTFMGSSVRTVEYGMARSDVFGNPISDQKRTGGIAT